VVPAIESSELSEGTRLLDRYTILDRVGSGGMATIYRATDERLDRVVCVKLLRLVVEGSEANVRPGVYRATYSHFLKEALALSRLQHPNTLRIYDFGYLDDGRPFQISEFLDGGNLDSQVRATGPFTRDEALAVLERITGAVAEAHAHGIIHRDIKPSNILFSRVGGVLMPKLADFGIAQSKLRKDDPNAPDPTDLVSTVALFSPRWAAPEQLAGGEEGPSTDVYALGLVTAYMLTARAAFADADVRSHFGDRIRGDAFVSERLAEIGITPDVRGVLLRALTADPGARLASPVVFFEALRSAIEGRIPRGLPKGPARRTFESITLLTDLSGPGAEDEPRFVAPPERTVELGSRLVRVVEINEKLDLVIGGEHELRFRVTLLPTRQIAENSAHFSVNSSSSAHFGGAGSNAGSNQGFAINVKGLNCFVTKERGRPTPAIVATGDGTADFVSSDQMTLGRLRWSFGAAAVGGPGEGLGESAGRLFRVEDEDLVITYREASQAVLLDLGAAREVIVMCKR
jgi:serine/threonine protein kinase